MVGQRPQTFGFIDDRPTVSDVLMESKWGDKGKKRGTKEKKHWCLRYRCNDGLRVVNAERVPSR